MAKRYRSTNFSKYETDVLKKILAQYTIIENKSKTMQVEWGKKEAWNKITEDFNSTENVQIRDVNQLKNSWKKMKAQAKSELNELIKQRMANQEISCIDHPSLEGTLEQPTIVKPEPSLSIPDQDIPDQVTLPLHGLLDTTESDNVRGTASDGDESKVSSRQDLNLPLPPPPPASKRRAAEMYERRIEMMEEEHKMKMQVLETELTNKLIEREQRLKEHEATLRNLDVVFEKLRNGDINNFS